MDLRKENTCSALESLDLTSDFESPSVVISGSLQYLSMHDDQGISAMMVHSEVFGFLGTDLETNTAAVDARPSVVACMSVWWWAKRQMSYAQSKSLNTSERVLWMRLEVNSVFDDPGDVERE